MKNFGGLNPTPTLCAVAEKSGQLLAALAVLLFLAIPSASVHAELLFYDGFDYEPGALHDQNGGIGWGLAAWNVPGDVTQSLDRGRVVEDGLTYTDGDGNQLLVSGRSVVSSGATGAAEPRREVPLTGTPGTTTWLSYIGQRLLYGDDPLPDNFLNRVATLQLRNVGGGGERLAIGKPTTGTTGSPIPPHTENWGIYPTNQAPARAQYSDVPQIETSFLVVRIDHHEDGGALDQAWLWVNPLLDEVPDVNAAIGATEAITPGGGDAANGFAFNHIWAFVGQGNNDGPYAQFAFDEIRVGTTYSAVTPIVPEPTSALLALVTLLGVAGTRVRW